MASDVTVPATIANGTTNNATDVMTNLITLRDWINANALHLDAAKNATGNQSVTVDPVGTNDYARKSYVDAGDTTPLRKGTIVTAAQSYSNGTEAVVSFTTEITDTDAYIAAPSTTVTVPAGLGGLYALAADLNYASGTTGGFSHITIRVNGTNVGADYPLPNYAGNKCFAQVFRVHPLSVGDTVTVLCANSTLGVLTFNVRLSVIRLGL